MRPSPGPLSLSARKRVAARAREASSSSEEEDAPRRSVTRSRAQSAQEFNHRAALDVVRGEFAASFGLAHALEAPASRVVASAKSARSTTSPVASRIAQLEEENDALSERLAAQQAVNAKLERRCEQASSDAAAYLRDLQALESEGRQADAAYASLLEISEEQKRQLRDLAADRDRAVAAVAVEKDLRTRAERSQQESEAAAETRRQEVQSTEGQLRAQIAQLQQQHATAVRHTEALAQRNAELDAQHVELNRTRAKLAEIECDAQRAKQRIADLESDLRQSRDSGEELLAQLRDTLSRSDARAEKMAAEHGRELSRCRAQLESLAAELTSTREAKDCAATAAAAAHAAVDAAKAEHAAAIEEIRTDSAAQLATQSGHFEDELSSREKQWEAERDALIREHQTATDREKTKVQEQLVKVADKLRKQLTAAERKNESLAKEAAQREEKTATEMDHALRQKDEQVAELRRDIQVAKKEASDVQYAASRVQRELEDARSAATVERMALKAVAEEAKDAHRRAEEELREAVLLAQRLRQQNQDAVDAELLLLRAQARDSEQQLALCQDALEKELAEVVAARTMVVQQEAEAAAAQEQSALEAERTAAVAAAASAFIAATASAENQTESAEGNATEASSLVVDEEPTLAGGLGFTAVEHDHKQRAKRVLAEGALNDTRAAKAAQAKQLVAAQSEASQLRHELMVRQQLSEQLSETLSRLQNSIDDQIAAEVESATEFQRDENMALKELLAALQQEATEMRAKVEEAQRREQAASKKVEAFSAASLATETKLRKELASALASADAAVCEEETARDEDAGREKESTAALRSELQSVEEQAAALRAELELLTFDNTELQSTVTTLSATVAIESEASATARAELEAAHRTIEKQRSRISSLRGQLARGTNASDESTSTSATRLRRNSDTGVHRDQVATSRARAVDAPRRSNSSTRARSVSPQVDGDYRKGGVSWGRGPGPTFGRASTGRSGSPELGKGGRRPVLRDESFDGNARQRSGGGSATQEARSERRTQHLPSAEQEAGGASAGMRGRNSLSPPPAAAVSSSPASAMALSRLLEERDRLRNVLALARDAHADEVQRLKSSLATATESARQWQQACTIARSQLAAAEAELKERRRKAARAAKSKHDAG